MNYSEVTSIMEYLTENLSKAFLLSDGKEIKDD